jgi:PAS domain S-box-containing protein
MRLQFEKVLSVLYLALLAAIILPVVVFYHYNSVFNQTSYWIRHNLNVLRHTEEIGILSRMVVLDANTFIITRNSRYRTGYNESKTQLQECIPRFRTLLKNNQIAASRGDSIIREVDSLLTITDSDVRLSMQAPLSPEQLRSTVENKLIYLNLIIKQVADIEAEERILLYDQTRSYRRTIAAYNKLFIIYVVLVIILLVVSFLSVRFNLRKRKAAEERLRLSDEELRLVFNSVKDYAIFRLDRDGIVLNCNLGAENLTGFTEQEIIGQSFRILYMGEDRQAGEPDRDLELAVKEVDIKKETWLMRKDGSRFWANMYITAIRDSQQNITGFTEVVQDFTVRKHLDKVRNRALKKERELNKLKSNFVAMASHEFKTPLTSILLAATAIREYKDRIDVEKYLGKIMENIRTLMTILEEFLSLEKMEAGKVVAHSDLFNVMEIAGKVCEEARMSDSHIVLYNHEGRSMFCLDPLIYKQILTNLVSNAIKYSPAGSTVLVNTSTFGDQLQSTVRDQGIGISKEDQKRLFERFFRASNVTGIQGTGLGLHLVKGYVDMLGGSVELKSEPGKGTEITVTLKECPPS